MKNWTLLIASIIWASSGTGFADESSYFNAYVNSPEGSSESPAVNPVKKDINASHDPKVDDGKKPDGRDADPVLQGIPAKWQACSVDGDCTAGVIDCVSWDPFNKKYLKKLSENLRSCSASVDPGFQPKTVCMAKVCKTTQDITGVSWEEWYNQMHHEKERSN